jgi:hypothetical protein
MKATTLATLIFTGMLAMTAQAAESQKGDTQSHVTSSGQVKQDSDKASTYDHKSPLISNGTEGPENGGTQQDKAATDK